MGILENVLMIHKIKKIGMNLGVRMVIIASNAKPLAKIKMRIVRDYPTLVKGAHSLTNITFQPTTASNK